MNVFYVNVFLVHVKEEKQYQRNFKYVLDAKKSTIVQENVIDDIGNVNISLFANEEIKGEGFFLYQIGAKSIFCT